MKHAAQPERRKPRAKHGLERQVWPGDLGGSWGPSPLL